MPEPAPDAGSGGVGTCFLARLDVISFTSFHLRIGTDSLLNTLGLSERSVVNKSTEHTSAARSTLHNRNKLVVRGTALPDCKQNRHS
jgi:hypothetical protein